MFKSRFFLLIRMISFFILFSCILLYLCIAFMPYSQEDKNLLDGISFSRTVEDRQGNLLRMSLSEDEKYRLTGRLYQVNPLTVQALLLYEDKYFYSHFGVNPFSLLRGAFETYVLNKRRVGGSTITMQVARLRFNLSTNSLVGKLRQIFYALQIEYHHSKEEILEAYFTLAPYGGNIEGIFSASYIYFHKPALKLTLSESLALATVPQNPIARNPLNGKDFDTARSFIYKIWNEKNNTALRPYPLRVWTLQDMPFLVPHLTQNLLLDPTLTASTICTYIDLSLQNALEQSITRFVSRNGLYGIKNAAALLIHAPSMEVRATVGSADFYNNDIEGQIDGTRTRRSPGSTLKPFIYALALEQGLIHAGSILLDTPRSFRGYDPENFDKSYSGPLSAADALKLSRNIPAITLASQIKYPDLYDFLKRADVRLAFDSKHYGLSLALGGAEVTMLELAQLYAMLSNSGIFQLIRFHSQAPVQVPLSLLSPEVAFITLNMLEDSTEALHTSQGVLPLRIKTGTSNGLRDAWAAGTVGEYILVVWIGNFNNASNPHFVGGEIATPLFIDTARSLLSKTSTYDIPPTLINSLNIKLVPVCSETGDIDISLCTGNPHVSSATKDIWYIPGKSPTKPTGILRKIWVDSETGYRVCGNDVNNAFIKEEVHEFWSSDMQKYFKQAGILKKAPPIFALESLTDPRCAIFIEKGKAPLITSPKEGLVYYKRLHEEQGITLIAQSDADVAWIYWFAGKTYIGKSQSSEAFQYSPSIGFTDLYAVDSFGRSAHQRIEMKLVP